MSTLGKSLDFIKQRIIDGCCINMDFKNYETAREFDFNDFIKLLDKKIQELYQNNNQLNITLDGDMNGIKGSKNISIVHNKYANFEYFTMESCACDGTLLFMHELMSNIFYKLFKCETYNLQNCPIDIDTNFWNYDVKYTVGDFVLNIENGDFGTDEKPWMHSRFTAILPVKCEFIKNSDLI